MKMMAKIPMKTVMMKVGTELYSKHQMDFISLLKAVKRVLTQ